MLGIGHPVNRRGNDGRTRNDPGKPPRSGDKLLGCFRHRCLLHDRDRLKTVRDYYAADGNAVRIEDVSPWLSELVENLVNDEPAEESI